MAGRILVVEDDATIWRGLHQALGAQGYEPDWADTGAGALVPRPVPPDLVLLDLGLPDIDGVEVCRRLRALYPQATIVILTARSDEIDVVIGLDAGADDYLVKPFRLAELLARIRAHLRRRSPDADLETVSVGTLSMDVGAHRVFVDGEELELRPKEFDLLALLLSEAGRVVPRERIMHEVWDEHWFGSTKTLDMHISSLRKRLGPTGDLITTLRGIGYRFEKP